MVQTVDSSDSANAMDARYSCVIGVGRLSEDVAFLNLHIIIVKTAGVLSQAVVSYRSCLSACQLQGLDSILAGKLVEFQNEISLEIERR